MRETGVGHFVRDGALDVAQIVARGHVMDAALVDAHAATAREFACVWVVMRNVAVIALVVIKHDEGVLAPRRHLRDAFQHHADAPSRPAHEIDRRFRKRGLQARQQRRAARLVEPKPRPERVAELEQPGVLACRPRFRTAGARQRFDPFRYGLPVDDWEAVGQLDVRFEGEGRHLAPEATGTCPGVKLDKSKYLVEHQAMRIEAVRRFNRFYTRRIGVLRRSHLGSPYSLPEARVLYELAQGERLTATQLGAELDLDLGYLSRLLQGLRRRGLVDAKAAAEDARQSLLSLSAKGRKAFASLDDGSRREMRAMLAPLSSVERARLVDAMSTVQSLLNGEKK